MDRGRDSGTHGFGPRGWLCLAGALLTINLALSFHNLWPTPWVTVRPELSVEAAVLVLALCAFAELRRVPSRRVAGWVACSLVLLAAGRYAEVTAPALFGRRINVWWDAPHLPSVVAMLVDAGPWWLRVAVPLAVIAGVAALYAVLRLALAGLWAGLALPAPRRAAAGLAAAACLAFAAGHLGAGTLRWFSLPVTRTYAQQAVFVHDALTGADVSADLDAPALPRSDLARAEGKDLLLLFLESYGAVAFEDPSLAARVRGARAALSRAVDEAGLIALSAWVDSPTLGGASWLAHATALSGIEVRDNASHAMLLTRDRDTLVHRFRERGWRAVAVMPGLKQAWPEGAFYGFDRVYGEQDLDYRGPAFGWWRVPDQFTLARIEQLELGGTPRSPVLVFLPTISTHAPFRPLPPYQPDWSRIAAAQPFDPPAVRASLAHTPEWSDPAPAYGDAVAYALRSLAGFVRHHADAAGAHDLVVVAMGDHQPPASVSGEGADHRVPLHVIARAGPLADALAAAGLAPGLSPADAASIPMRALAPLLLDALGGAPSRESRAPGQDSPASAAATGSGA